MKALTESWLMRSRYPHAVAAGVLLALAFPNCEIAGLAWVGPALMLAAAVGTDGRQSFRIGYVAGLAYHLTSLNWLLLIPVAFFPILGWLALSAYLSLFTATWVWGSWRLWPGRTARPESQNGEPSWLLNISWPGAMQRIGWTVCVAALWVALEIVRARLLGGFPWNPLGASQFELVPLIQISSVTGVYGVSFLIVWFSAGLVCCGLAMLRTAPPKRTWITDLMLPLLAIATTFAWGVFQIRDLPRPDRILRVAVIQPSIPQSEIWDPDENSARFADVIRLSKEALQEKPDLLLWPEAAVPELIRWDEATYEAITGLALSNQTWMIIGADDAIPGVLPEDEVTYYNSAWLIDQDGEISSTYRKQQLVAFGEEVPFIRWLPFLKWFTPITGSFTRGTRFVPFVLDSLELQTSTLICFEDVFPHLVRHCVTPDLDFMVNLTNDGWFKQGAAQRQQAANSVFRSVENRRPLIRCTNNGQTCWIDAIGRVIERFTDNKGRIYGPGWAVFSVGVSDNFSEETTFYTRHGDSFGWMCSVLSGCGLLIVIIRRKIPIR